MAKEIGRAPIAAVLAVVVFVILFLFGPFNGLVKSVFAGVMAAAVSAFYAFLPELMQGRKGDRIDDSLPFFITHFGVLATSNMPRGALLRMLSENEEYPEIASEVGRILRLTTEWGLSLAESVRAVSESTPSVVFGEFLLRLGHALETGQDLGDFLHNEQSVVMHEYSSLYQANLLKVENWKEMYQSTIMTIGFLGVFAVVIPLLSGGSIMVLMWGVAGMTVFLELMLGMVLKERLPSDRLRPRRPLNTKVEQRIRLATTGSIALAILLAVLAFTPLHPAIAYSIAALPLLIPGILAINEEKAIRQRESDFPAFIRSVGAAAAARGGGVREVLAQVQANKLGALASPVRSLHRRLSWRVDDAKAWKRFGEETGSRLIDSFTDMFVEGVRAGGKPAVIAGIISDNMVRILALRTTRRATAGAFKGLLMGLAGGVSLVLFMGNGIFTVLLDLFAGQADALAGQGIVDLGAAPPPGAVEAILYPVLVFHGAASGLFYKLVEGGRVEGAGLWSAFIIWVGVGIAGVTMLILPRFFGFA